MKLLTQIFSYLSFWHRVFLSLLSSFYLGFGIGRILKVSNVTVLYWIRTLGKSIKSYVQTQMPDDIRHVDTIEMDEMWHFTTDFPFFKLCVMCN